MIFEIKISTIVLKFRLKMSKNSTSAKKYAHDGHLFQTKAVFFLQIEKLSELCALISLIGSCQFKCFSLGSLWSFCHGQPHHNSHNAFPGKNNVKGIVLPADDTRQTAFSTTSSTSLFSNVDVFLLHHCPLGAVAVIYQAWFGKILNKRVKFLTPQLLE